MFNIGAGEMMVIFLLALLVLGPERLPKAMGQVGRAVAQMRKLSSGFQDEIRRAMDPIEAPFRPGEETLAGPMPSATDEVKVVNTGKDDLADLDQQLAPVLDKPVLDKPVVIDKPEGTVTPLRPVAQPAPEAGDAAADAG